MAATQKPEELDVDEEVVVRMAWEHRKNTGSGSMMARRLVMISRCDYDFFIIIIYHYYLSLLFIIIIY
jgi:hypothetical protein